jgi:hypothetical protein
MIRTSKPTGDERDWTPYLRATIALSILGVACCLCALLLTIRAVVAAVPGEIAATRASLIDQGAALRLDTFAEIDAQATGIRADVKMSTTSLQTLADKQLSGIRTDLTTNLQQTTASILAQVPVILEPVNGIRADLKPVLANAAALTKDVQDSLDDLYPDVRGLVESTDVAVTQTAQTMQTVREAAPQIAAAAVSVGKSAAVIADSAAQEAKKLTQPMTRRQKVMVWLELLPRIGLKIL